MHLSCAESWHVCPVPMFPMIPAAFPLGSPQSRAAARGLLETRLAGRQRIQVVFSISRPNAQGVIRIGDWTEGHDGTLFRTCNIPAGMTFEEAQRIVSQPGWKPTAL